MTENEDDTAPPTATPATSPPGLLPPEPTAGLAAREAPEPSPGDAAPDPGDGGVPDPYLDGDELVLPGVRRVSVALLRGAQTTGGRFAAEVALRLELRSLGLSPAEEDQAVAVAAERLV